MRKYGTRRVARSTEQQGNVTRLREYRFCAHVFPFLDTKIVYGLDMNLIVLNLKKIGQQTI